MDLKVIEIVKKKLLKIEKEHNVSILYAIESGSRAWGFESTDRDYDIRFIYAHNRNWYLNILPKKDVIEYPIESDFDYSGWDLRKTLFLANKSNPVLFEWLRSPIVYFKDEYFFNKMKQLSTKYFSPISSCKCDSFDCSSSKWVLTGCASLKCVSVVFNSIGVI